MSEKKSTLSPEASATEHAGAEEGTVKDTVAGQPIPLPDSVASTTSTIAAPPGDDVRELPKDSDEMPTIKEPAPDPVQSAGGQGVDDQDIDVMLREIGWESRGKQNKPTATKPPKS